MIEAIMFGIVGIGIILLGISIQRIEKKLNKIQQEVK